MLKTLGLPEDLAQKLAKGKQTLPPDINPDFEIVRQLGWGYEGFVYLVRDRASGRKLVVKIYHDPFDHEEGIWNGLQQYADRVQENPYGLYPIQVKHKSGQIIASQYPYEPLYSLPYRFIGLSSQIGRSMLGQFCMMQSYLLSQCGIGITDPVPDNFLLDRHGQFHFTDFGLGIRTIDEPIARTRGLFGYGFAALLLAIHNVNLREKMRSHEDYDYDRPCIYNAYEGLDEVAARHPWVQPILEQVRKQKASTLRDPDFYRGLGMTLPQRVEHPQTLITAIQLIGLLKSAKSWRTTKAQ